MAAVSDGYHTFDELYEHRHTLYLALCRNLAEHADVAVWRAQEHFDGSMYPDWFILGINKEPGKQITYHLPLYLWDQTQFAETLSRAPEWDRHTPADVLTRLAKLGGR